MVGDRRLRCLPGEQQGSQRHIGSATGDESEKECWRVLRESRKKNLPAGEQGRLIYWLD